MERTGDSKAKKTVPLEGFGASVGRLLDGIQIELFRRAQAFRKPNTVEVASWSDFQTMFADEGSTFAYAHWDGTVETELAIKEATRP